MKRRLAFMTAGFILLLSSLLLFFTLSIPTLNGKNVSFQSSYGERKVTLKGTYYEAKSAEYAVLVCPGYSCDRTKWRPVANELIKNDMSVLLFDYSGQGASYGTIGFDNAKTDNISEEIYDAILELQKLSGVPVDHIILLGHSMGGRSILRLLYDMNNEDAVTNVKPLPIPAVILFSPEVNYDFNAQASLFAGTSDAVESPWDKYSPDDIGKTSVYLYGSTSDDIVKDEDIHEIFRRIGGEDINTSGTFEKTNVNKNGARVTVGVTSGILHSYQMYSSKFSKYLSESLASITEDVKHLSAYNHTNFDMIYVGWGLSLLGLFLLFYGFNSEKREVKDLEMKLLDPKKFLLWKLFMWLPGILFAFIICCILVILPCGSPVMNIPYMCFISGYGLTMFFAYRKGKFKGTTGHLPKFSLKVEMNKKDLLTCVGVTVVTLGFSWFVFSATMYRLIPLNFRLLYVGIATILMCIGYFISGAEKEMLEKSNASTLTKFLYNLIQYIPLFLLVMFYLVIKSYSGMIGQMQNMILMYIFCVPLGDFIRNKTKNRLLGALFSAMTFQTIMITSAALISMF